LTLIAIQNQLVRAEPELPIRHHNDGNGNQQEYEREQ
jgi:hypothetical protein